MSIESNYRTSIDKQEIINALIDIFTEKSPVTVWQNDGVSRLIVNVRIEAIDAQSSSMYITPFSLEDQDSFFKIQFNLAFYVKGETRSIIFKQDQPTNIGKNGLVQIYIPEIVKMFEKRSEQRIDFSKNPHNLTTEIYPGDRIDVSSKSMRGELLNVSLSGMGFLLEKKNARLFFEKDQVKIKAIAKYTFTKPIYGNIIYLKNDYSNVKKVRLGVQFIEKIAPEILKKISDLSD